MFLSPKGLVILSLIVFITLYWICLTHLHEKVRPPKPPKPHIKPVTDLTYDITSDEPSRENSKILDSYFE
jgi:hypothetical protein